MPRGSKGTVVARDREHVGAAEILRQVEGYVRVHGISENDFVRRAGRTKSLLTSLKAAADRDGTINLDSLQDIARAMNTTVGRLLGEADGPTPGQTPFVDMEVLYEAATKLYEVRAYQNGALFAADLARVCSWLNRDPVRNRIDDLTPAILAKIVDDCGKRSV